MAGSSSSSTPSPVVTKTVGKKRGPKPKPKPQPQPKSTAKGKSKAQAASNDTSKSVSREATPSPAPREPVRPAGTSQNPPVNPLQFASSGRTISQILASNSPSSATLQLSSNQSSQSSQVSASVLQHGVSNCSAQLSQAVNPYNDLQLPTPQQTPAAQKRKAPFEAPLTKSATHERAVKFRKQLLAIANEMTAPHQSHQGRQRSDWSDASSNTAASTSTESEASEDSNKQGPHVTSASSYIHRKADRSRRKSKGKLCLNGS